jgi:hypothetical protein
MKVDRRADHKRLRTSTIVQWPDAWARAMFRGVYGCLRSATEAGAGARGARP